MDNLPTGYELREGADARAAQTFLVDSYWNKGITPDEIALALAHSFAISIWHAGQQVGMARVVSDRVTIAYLNDVYVLKQHRGKGLATAMIEYVRSRPEFEGVGRWLLFTKDAQPLYRALGWQEYLWPSRTMIVDHTVFPK